MATYIFTYRTPQRPLSEVLAKLDEPARAARLSAWYAWMESMGDSLLERGNPVNDARTIGTTEGTRIGGYSLVTAESFEAALALAQGCPGLAFGGGVEVGEFAELSVPTAATARGAASDG